MVRLLIDCPDIISQIPVVIAHCFSDNWASQNSSNWFVSVCLSSTIIIKIIIITRPIPSPGSVAIIY